MRVIFLHADGLPAWALGAYGNEWIPTPNIDEFAAGAVVFDAHFADVPRRLSANDIDGRLAYSFASDDATQGRSTLSHHLARAGQPYLAGESEELTQLLEKFAECRRGLLWIDLPTLLPPWPVEDDGEGGLVPIPDPTPGFIDADDDELMERLQRTFGAVVEQFDAVVGECLSRLRERRLLDQSLVILTSGRGQHLGEHGMIGEFRPWLHDEVVHLPLILRWPEAGEGRRVPHLTQLVDLMPTILSALEIESPADRHGHDLRPLCRGGGPVRDYFVAASAGPAIEFALQSAHEKIIAPPQDSERGPMYFVKPDDRWEVNNLWTPNVDRAEALEKTMREFVAAAQRPGPSIPPALPQPEADRGDSQTGGGEHDGPASESGVRRHQGDEESGDDQ